MIDKINKEQEQEFKIPERQIPNEYEFDEILERRFTDSPNTPITATIPKEIILDKDFMSASNNFWLSHEGGMYYQRYNEGVLNGTYNERKANFTAITDTILEAFRNILRTQCEKEDKTLEEFSAYLDMLGKTFELLSNKINTTLDNPIDGELMLSYLHAVFNSFISTNIRQKD